MGLNPIILVCVWLAASAVCIHCYACGPCTCAIDDKGKVAANCSGLGLTSIPKDLPRQTRFLDMSKNRLDPEHLEDLCGFALKTLNLSGNHLTSLSSDQFGKCFITGLIDFGENVIDTIDEESLRGLQDVVTIVNLESRNFKPNALSALQALRELSIIIHQTNLSSDLFSDLRRLESLTVDFRVDFRAHDLPDGLLLPVCKNLKRLTLETKYPPVISGDILAGCVILEEFKLSAKDVHSVPATLFESTPALTSITMSGVSSLPRNVFRDLDKLTALEIHDVVDMPSDVFVDRIELRNLDLARCSIAEIQHGLFNNLWSLETLILDSVGLQALTSENFIGLKSLRGLELSNNNLRSLDQHPFQKLQSTIRYIGLRENHLKHVKNDTFDYLTVLEKIDLSSNQIHSVDVDAFKTLSALKSLSLQGNKIYSFPERVFEHNGALETLDLSSNVIGEIFPDTFTHLYNIRVLNVSNNLLRSVPNLSKSSNSINRILDASLNRLHCVCMPPAVMEDVRDVEIRGSCYIAGEKHMGYQEYIQSPECLSRYTSPTPLFVMSTATQHTETEPKHSTQVTSTVKTNHTMDDKESKTTGNSTTNAGIQRETRTEKSHPMYKTTIKQANFTKVTDVPYDQHKNDTVIGVQTSTVTAHTTNDQHKNDAVIGVQTSIVTAHTTNDQHKNDAVIGVQTSTVTAHTTNDQHKNDAVIGVQTSTVTAHTTNDQHKNDAVISVQTSTVTAHTTNDQHKNDAVIGVQTSTVTARTTKPTTIITNVIGTTDPPKDQTDGTYNGTFKLDDGLAETAYAFESAEPTDDSYIIAVVCITSVSVLAVGFLVFLWYRKSRRRRGYEVSNVEDQDMDNYIRGGPVGQSNSEKEAMSLRDVPSIQIETIDDQDRVHVVEYPTTQNKD